MMYHRSVFQVFQFSKEQWASTPTDRQECRILVDMQSKAKDTEGKEALPCRDDMVLLRFCITSNKSEKWREEYWCWRRGVDCRRTGAR
jgi:hypothetical protein